jgi:radical SAM protein with 4Fe4S-binding SPASM domain
MVSELLRVARDPTLGPTLRERSPDRFAKSRRGVPVVVWNVVGHCNLACPHCYASASRRPSDADLDTADGLALIERLAAAGTKVIIFSGGEPLLRPDLLELVAHARALGLVPQLSTNGVLLDAAAAAKLRDAGVRYVGISIDGRSELNDRYRGMCGAYERALAGISHARAAGMRTGLRITISRLNHQELEPLLELAAERGIDRFYVSHLLYSGRALRMQRQDLTPSDARRLLERLFQRADALLDAGSGPEIVTGGNDSDGPALLAWVAARRGARAAAAVDALLRARGGNCAAEKILDIDHLGRVHPDQFWQSATLGNVREQSIEQILAHPLRAELALRERRLTGRCARCVYLPHCRGSHRERALGRHGDPWAPDPACVMTDPEIEPASARQEWPAP